MALILVPLTMTATRLHAHTLDAPDLATQEMNRCLRLVKIAASRRTGRRTNDARLPEKPYLVAAFSRTLPDF